MYRFFNTLYYISAWALSVLQIFTFLMLVTDPDKTYPILNLIFILIGGFMIIAGFFLYIKLDKKWPSFILTAVGSIFIIFCGWQLIGITNAKIFYRNHLSVLVVPALQIFAMIGIHINRKEKKIVEVEYAEKNYKKVFSDDEK